ncbi:unnamed protein product [[Actinomadura] parvosata subsp. kistnae]|nr:unnamed protein product [Actinomadura parvosata subsp. kistnae]
MRPHPQARRPVLKPGRVPAGMTASARSRRSSPCRPVRSVARMLPAQSGCAGVASR